jgi:hypothetical protein
VLLHIWVLHTILLSFYVPFLIDSVYQLLNIKNQKKNQKIKNKSPFAASSAR